jgi:hypothetical protein
MFGMKEGGKKPIRYAFDLEKDIKAKPAHGKELVEKMSVEMQHLKNKMGPTGGLSEKEYDELGAVYNAFHSAQKVVKKIMK